MSQKVNKALRRQIFGDKSRRKNPANEAEWKRYNDAKKAYKKFKRDGGKK